MLPSSNEYSSSKSLISSSSSSSAHSRLSEAVTSPRYFNDKNKVALSSSVQRNEGDVTAETSLAASESEMTSSSKSTSDAFFETSYPSTGVSSSHGPTSSTSPHREHRHRHHGYGHKSKPSRKAKPTSATFSSNSSDSGSISPCPSSVSSTSSMHENHSTKSSIDSYEKSGGDRNYEKRFKLLNFFKIKPSAMVKSRTVDQIKCICRNEKKFDCLKCTSNYPVHVNRSKDGEEDRGRSSMHERHLLDATKQTPNKPAVNSSANSGRPQLAVSVPIRRSDGSHDVLFQSRNNNNIASNFQPASHAGTRRSKHEFLDHQTLPSSKTFSNFSSLNPVQSAIKLKPSPFPVSNQLLSFLEQLHPSNSFKVPPNVNPFT